MEPIAKEFKAFKSRLNNLIITKGKITVNENDFLIVDTDDEPYIDIQPVYTGIPRLIKIDGFVLNHEDNKFVLYNSFEKEFLAVRNELENNFKSTLINDLEKYLNEIINTYIQFENKIVEGEDGHFSSDLIKFDECDLDTINKHSYCKYDQFLEGLKHQFREEIIYMNNFLKSNESYEVKGFKRIRFRTKINVLVTLFYDLKDKHYIDSSDANLNRFLQQSFSDENGETLSKSTIETILNSSRVEKRAKDDVRIKVPEL